MNKTRNKYLITPTVIFLIFMASCNRSEFCNITNFKDLPLKVANVLIKLPPYKIKDTLIYDGGKKVLLNYNLVTEDSLMNIFVTVKTYERDTLPLFDIREIMSLEKEEAEFGQDSLFLIKENFKELGNIKIGYLKYLDTRRNRYEGRIAFYNSKKLISLWLYEKFESTTKNNSSLIDCVLENINIHQ
jgi:hypothetical protein